MPRQSLSSETAMASPLRIAMNGITGRMGYHQHLVRSILPVMPFIAMRRGDAMAVSELKDCLGMDRLPRAGDGRPSRGMRFPEKGRSRGNRRQGAGGAPGPARRPPRAPRGEDG